MTTSPIPTPRQADPFRKLNAEIWNLIDALEKIESLIGQAGHRGIPQYLEAFTIAQNALRRAKGDNQ
jgi:hypothetical protein